MASLLLSRHAEMTITRRPAQSLLGCASTPTQGLYYQRGAVSSRSSNYLRLCTPGISCREFQAKLKPPSSE